MNNNIISSIQDRRCFLFNLVRTGGFVCFMNHGLLAQDNQSAPKGSQTETHKFKNDSKMTWEEVFQMTYSSQFVPFITYLGQKIGKEELISHMKTWIEDRFKNVPKREDRDFSELVKRLTAPSSFKDSVLTVEVMEKTETVLETKTTECLWAKTFRDAKAEDYGYAYICYPDLFKFLPWNSKLRVRLTKTLMQGHEYCDHRFYLET